MTRPRWGRCIYHQGYHTEEFLKDYLSEPQRRVLLIAGASFDPRSTVVARHLVQYANGQVRGYFLREERPRPDADLAARATQNEQALRRLLPDSTVTYLDVFAADNAVVGGRTAVRLISTMDLNDITDLFFDLSVLSIGVAFPIVRYLNAEADRLGLNLHLIVADEPKTDIDIIRTTATDMADAVHGFKGGWGLDANSRAALLWMPQLAWGKRGILERIRQKVKPHAFCPILPFPADNPRLPDELIEHYAEEFNNSWRVDSRDIVYASDRSPLDLYRSILRIDNSRKRVFAEIGGSQIILSPVGSKALAVGALMAALERDFTIMYVEALAYSIDLERLDKSRKMHPIELVHVWLCGEAYPQLSSEEASE